MNISGIHFAKIATGISLFVIAVIVALGDGKAGVKAPLLTMLGGITILVTFLPERKPNGNDFGLIAGTAMAVTGSYFWLLAETPVEEHPFIPSILILLLYAAVAIAFLVWFGVWVCLIGFQILRHLFSRMRHLFSRK